MDHPDDSDAEELSEWHRAKAQWDYIRELEQRLDALEEWRAVLEALEHNSSLFRQWAIPVFISLVGVVLTAVNTYAMVTRH